jgi:hypothetical protein
MRRTVGSIGNALLVRLDRRHRIVALGLIAALTICLGACGGDDDSDAADTAGAAAVPAPKDAFGDLAGALEGQGLVVSSMPGDALHGAVVGVRITGHKSGTALLFSTEEKAKARSDVVDKAGDDSTTVVGTAVFQAPTQADVNFFADAYEGG